MPRIYPCTMHCCRRTVGVERALRLLEHGTPVICLEHERKASRPPSEVRKMRACLGWCGEKFLTTAAVRICPACTDRGRYINQSNQYAGTCVMRMQPFLEFGGYDKDVVPDGFPCGLEDFNLFVHFLRNGYTTKVIPEVLLFARQRPEQNNRRLYGTPLYSKMVHKVCEKNGIKVVMHDPEKPGDPMRYTLEYEQHTREACTSSPSPS